MLLTLHYGKDAGPKGLPVRLLFGGEPSTSAVTTGGYIGVDGATVLPICNQLTANESINPDIFC